MELDSILVHYLVTDYSINLIHKIIIVLIKHLIYFCVLIQTF